MTFTSMVISEIVRLSNIVLGVFRRRIKEVEKNGYMIPVGWVVMVRPPAVHLNSAKYEDPLGFNPLRWEQLGMEMSVGSKIFMAFGGGPRWMIVKGGDIVRRPGLIFPYGIHMQLTEKEGNGSKIVV
ncbi:hypothetical protein GIB67_010527 [Kingdonia uniflora]|uniref:Uncharacterized protein n=1 Tax=Kingdonia uniflora TaxID=39325 RepID=A0A7J7MAN8_9MAGN|nr:hypothetical protein GIB67_010527 [Kingdonia uniflora]